MTPRSPIVAMLWENWRLTRVEAVQRLSFGLVGGAAALALLDAGATVAVWILLSQYAMFWMSIAKLTGGRFVDGYRPGFPLHLLYARPVATTSIVGVAMGYDALSSAVLYLVSAALLGLAFGQPLPLLPMALAIAVFHVVCTTIQWSTRSRVVQWAGSGGIWIAVIALLADRPGGWPVQVQFSLTETALMVVTGVLSFALTVAGVARQRRGDSSPDTPRSAGAAGFQEWLASLFPLPCPTSSPTRAQVWFDLKSSGLPVLTIGLALAIVTPLVFALAIPFAGLRPVALGFAVYPLPVVLLLGGNAFGIRRKQGHVFASVFDATQPSRTGRLAGLKVLARAACLLIAAIAVCSSLWVSTSLVTRWMGDGRAAAMDAAFWDLPNPRRAELIGPHAHAVWLLRHTIEEGVAKLSRAQLAALAVLVPMGLALFVAVRAAFTALRARYPNRVNTAGGLLLFYGLAFVLRARDGQGGDGWEVVFMDALFGATFWMAAPTLVLTTAYLLWRVLVERLLPPVSASIVVLVSAAVAAAWVTVISGAGVPLGAMSAADAARWVWPALLPLMVGLLAPWSLSRIRHL